MKSLFKMLISVKLLVLSALAVSALSFSAPSVASPEMFEVNSLIYELEYRYQPNIRLIPQHPAVNAPRVWKNDLIRLNEILDYNLPGQKGELTTLACDKVVCACDKVVCSGEFQP